MTDEYSTDADGWKIPLVHIGNDIRQQKIGPNIEIQFDNNPKYVVLFCQRSESVLEAV